jgi:flagellar biosynthesis protein
MDDRRAAAIRYDQSLPAPFVVASGRGEMARRLIDVARRCGVPVSSAPELAERLVELDPGVVIPPELFAPVAEILAVILKVDESLRYDKHHEKNSGK